MNKFEKFNIIKEAQNYGVSHVCRKYSISRTIYYRWLKRYKSDGIDGLDPKEKFFTPVNKTSEKIENIVLNLIRTYPSYGPRAINYLLEDIGHDISESAVFNIMKRHHLTNRKLRMRYAKRQYHLVSHQVLSIPDLSLGECWIFFITTLGHFEKIGSLYMYTFIDVKSKIACSRLYDVCHLDKLEDLLTAVALPVAQTLNFQQSYLCFNENSPILSKSHQKSQDYITNLLCNHGVNINVQILKDQDNIDYVHQEQMDYTNKCLSFLLPYIQYGHNLSEVKLAFQSFIRNYNLSSTLDFEDGKYSPIEYYSKHTSMKQILPLWAYMDRDY